MDKKNNVIVIDVNNVQQDYSNALELIEYIENVKNWNDLKKIKSRMITLLPRLDVRSGIAQQGLSAKYFEMPIYRKTGEETFEETQGIEDVISLVEGNFNGNRWKNIIEDDNKRYHIRVRFEDGENSYSIVNLQYLVLLLQKLEYLFKMSSAVKQRLSAFMIPAKEGETYQDVSHYLRLISKDYTGVIFGAKSALSGTEIKSLDFKIHTKSQDFFPVIPVDIESYQLLFEEAAKSEDLQELCQLGKRNRFREAANIKERVALRDYIAESAYRKLEDICSEEQEIKNRFFYKIINKNMRMSWIAFALFCYILQKNDVNSESAYEDKLEEALDLSDGIRQIVQNAIQHSQTQKGVFSFYLHTDKNSDEPVLEIFVSDLNSQYTIMENFACNLEKEKDIFKDNVIEDAYEDLIKQRERFTLANFFAEFKKEDAVSEWKTFRKESDSSHVGLLLFSIIAQRCGASIEVGSSKLYVRDMEKEYFYRSSPQIGQTNQNEDKENADKENAVIPGTQFCIKIPLQTIRKIHPQGIGQIQKNSTICEDYDAYAQYIDTQEKRIKFEDEFDEVNKKTEAVCKAEEKRKVITLWANGWMPILNKLEKTVSDKQIYFVDMQEKIWKERLKNADDMEMMIKGLFDALRIKKDLKLSAWAFINVKEEFLRVFRDVCITFSARKFPEGLQLYVCEENCMDSISLFGKTFNEAIHNGYLLAIEHGTGKLSTSEYLAARELFEKIAGETDKRSNEKQKVNVVPFDVILNFDKNTTIFERRIYNMANQDIDGEDAGYKIKNTHMRLGSKVHIEDFYEMTFLFYRTGIANRIAFNILRDIKQKDTFENIDIEEEAVLFLGYASYSKAILSSLTEIFKSYRKLKNTKGTIGFASYQHNLQSESEDIQMYYEFEKDFPVYDDKGIITAKKAIKVVQVVPISSTLTTFEKMWIRFTKDVEKDSIQKIQLYGNYSVFWVKNSEESEETGSPSLLECKYWKSYSRQDKTVETNLKLLDHENRIKYFICQPVKWHSPLKCELCYPSNVLNEVPLVETDQTSTVPAQQIRRKKVKSSENRKWDVERYLALEGCIAYGHVKRDRNHFMTYIDTQAYFSKEKENVKAWLEEKSKESEKNESNETFPFLNIIFSPEHNTNVGFAQYVNTYYFRGSAEIVSINEDKEYRSNFECEHAALIKTIEVLFHNIECESAEDLPIRFYYVDDTIISGGTFQKANSFLKTLLPKSYRKYYKSNLISKCFLLVDRMSDSSKESYVQNVQQDFLSFLHLDVSNMRNQGDSCVGCKLEREAVHLFKQSATNNAEKYWISKMEEYHIIAYDDKKKMEKICTKSAFQNLILSHVAQNVIFNDNDFYEYGSAYDSILYICYRLIREKTYKNDKVIFHFEELLNGVNDENAVSEFLRIISRPFFSFDFKLKSQVLTLLVILTEVMLNDGKDILNEKSSGGNGVIFQEYLQMNNKRRVQQTVALGQKIRQQLKGEEEIYFLQNQLMQCLCDMRSTYLLRKQTINKMYHYVKRKKLDTVVEERFWRKYITDIQYIIECSSDEMRSLGLECLLISGMEYIEFEKTNSNNVNFTPLFLYESITGNLRPEYRDTFYLFCHELMLQNSVIPFVGLEKVLDRGKNSDVYFMEQWKQARCFEQFKVYQNIADKNELDSLHPSNEEQELFSFLSGNEWKTGSSQIEVKKRYDRLLKLIEEMIRAKYKVEDKNIRISLLTQTPKAKSQDAEIEEFDILSNINVKKADDCYDVKSCVAKVLQENKKEVFNLEEDGYYISENGEDAEFILFYRNPNNNMDSVDGRRLKSIAKVFLYVGVKNLNDTERFYYTRFMMRDILSYKNRMMRIFESDFTGDMFTKYSHTTGEKNIFAHEKAINHNTIVDSDEMLQILKKHTESRKYEMLDDNQSIKWLALRNYVNEQIARIFNRCFLRQEREKISKKTEGPQLYLDENINEYLKDNDYCQKFEIFDDLQFFVDDRFSLLASAIDIKIEDLHDIHLIKNSEDSKNQYYNLEYMKCLFFDIIFSAMKYQSDYPDFLERVDKFMRDRRLFAIHGWLSEEDKEIYGKERCIISVYKENSLNNQVFDYLVFENPVQRIIRSVEDENEKIRKRLEDPLDYQDGHMSLLTIKRYVEGLRYDLKGKCIFQYVEKDEKITFQTKLPIIERGCKSGKDILDRR